MPPAKFSQKASAMARLLLKHVYLTYTSIYWALVLWHSLLSTQLKQFASVKITHRWTDFHSGELFMKSTKCLFKSYVILDLYLTQKFSKLTFPHIYTSMVLLPIKMSLLLQFQGHYSFSHSTPVVCFWYRAFLLGWKTTTKFFKIKNTLDSVTWQPSLFS